jgi:subtilase family serine protease
LKRLLITIALIVVPLLIGMQRSILPVVANSAPRPVPNLHSKLVCGIPAPRFAGCHAAVATNSAGVPEASAAPSPNAYTSVQFHTAYNLPCTPGGPVQAVCSAPATFGGQTIGIVDAFDDPSAEADLAAYDTQYGLPACTTSNGCFRKVDQTGGTSYPVADQGWSLEISLDVQVAHMICQSCKILLVEANTNSFNDLSTSVNEAVALGATEVSNSYGGSEGSWETSFDSAYSHSNVAITASTGDGGYGTLYPSTSPGVLAVGGTTLRLNADNTYSGESVWSGSGSGCSSYENAQSWQAAVSTWSQTQCTSLRGAADVAADADPSTGASIYDGQPYGSATAGWWQVGGTSLSAPLIAAVIALAGGTAGVANAGSVPYAHFSASNSHDVATGSDGTCTTIMCTAVSGYDGPTGLGSPSGTSGFGSGSGTPIPVPSSTPTPTSTPKPANTPTPVPTRVCRTTGSGKYMCH